MAVAWQVLFAECLHVSITAAAVVALALAVWLIYAVDRLLDVARSRVPFRTRRHEFHRQHARELAVVAVGVFLALTAVVFFLRPVLLRDGLLLSFVLAAYFVIIHFLPRRVQQFCPKELVVGVVFAIGACLAPWSRLSDTRALVPPALLFAALCCLNCVAIETWEWTRSGAPAISRPHAITLWLARRVRLIAYVIAASATVLFFTSGAQLLFAAIAISAVAFGWVDKERDQLSQDALRVLADVPLLSPLLLIGIR